MKSGERWGYQARTWDVSHMPGSSEKLSMDPKCYHFLINLQSLIKNNTPPKYCALESQFANGIQNGINIENSNRVFEKTASTLSGTQ